MVNVREARRDSEGEAQLRRAYFAQAAELAMRYSVAIERLLEHIAHARTRHSRLDLNAVRYVEDLVHAVACIDNVEVAWRDLVDQHERALIRACRQWLDDTDAIVFVRRLLARVRANVEDGPPTLRSFDGTTSLRRWLGDRLVGDLNRHGDGLGGPPRPGRTWQPVILWNDPTGTPRPPRDRLREGGAG